MSLQATFRFAVILAAGSVALLAAFMLGLVEGNLPLGAALAGFAAATLLLVRPLYRLERELPEMEQYIDALEQRIRLERNRMVARPAAGRSPLEGCFARLEAAALNYDAIQQKNLGIFGEIMIVCEKVADGILNERIVMETENPQIHYISRSLNRMFDQLEATMGRIGRAMATLGEGDYTVRTECGGSGGTFAEMVESLNTLAETLSMGAQNSHSYSGKLSEQTGVLERLVEQIARASAESAASMEETAATLEQFGVSIEKSGEGAETMGRIARDAGAAVTEGKSLSEASAASLEKASHSVTRVREASEQIGQITSQTKILALNASIEAQNAGEAGKGFAVVAREVGKLAENNERVLSEIRRAVRELEAASGDAVREIRALGMQFDRIETGAKRTVELSDDVRHAIREQRSGIGQINEAVGSLDSGMQEQAHSAEVLKDVSGQVRHVSNELYEGIKAIRYA